MIAAMRKYLFSGLLVWLPLIITIFVLKFIFDLLNKSLLLLPHDLQPDTLLGFHIPGMGAVLTILVIFLTGLFAANFIGSRLVAFGMLSWRVYLWCEPFTWVLSKCNKPYLRPVVNPFVRFC